jgi:nitroimidazol reductase NimA-like FMN-containing flavoprotein (pyridoxamine 5'-phosphate oxidase superfamily)
MTVESLEKLGIEHMSEENIENFLKSQGVGILALPTDGAPYIFPLSFGYDGKKRLYFTFVTSDSSEKAELTSEGGEASFLIYTAESPFSWRSVVCQGTVSEVPREDWGDHDEAMADNAWHPDLFERAFELEEILVYQFEIEEWSGLRHAGLPPGLEAHDIDEETSHSNT